MIIICQVCERRRVHEARGLCHSCYQRALKLGMLRAFPKCGRKPGQNRTAYWREWKRQKTQERKAQNGR